ncbi:acyl-CoA dehydrogenase family protein [Mesorhizobium caraganae]|uniref:acyl-CoA dehydrogenase family protein n=1 Tax=Mesorhizobium caraganae TaxID=483206 RepID=UPI003ECC8162
MNFDLTGERQMLQDSLRRFLRGFVTQEILFQATESPQGHSKDLWGGLVEMGVPGALFAEQVGGFGGSGFDLSVVFEELGRAGVFEPLMEAGILAGGLIASLATADQLALVGEIISGRIVTLAHTEQGGRYDLAHVETRATRQDGRWVLSGGKSLVVAAPAASLAVVSARVSGAADERNGITLFVIPLDSDGLALRSYPLNGGGRAAELSLDGVAVPDSQRLGEVGGAFDAIEAVHARAVAAQCAEAVGLMESIKHLTVEYLRTRKQFGQPIGKFQALQHRMADMLIEIEQARSAAINVCGHLDAPRGERELQVSAAKNLIGRVSRIVVEEAIQMHGGIGITMEYALGHLAKRLTMIEHRFGDSDFHLERFIALSTAA